MSNSTTLITFLLRAPEGTFAVELLGSWDNFSKPYKLIRDRRTGDHNWRGCHFFEGITCDGDTSDLSAIRNGGLMMGGTYWYFYRLNSEIEYHDPSEPYTSSCPLLPGQPVNVLEVPIEPSRPSSGRDSSDSIDSLVFTLDPRDKYLPPGVRRARTTSAIQQRKALVPNMRKMPLASLDRHAPDAAQSPPASRSTREGPTLRPQRSLISIFDKLRRTKSAGSSTPRAATSWHRKVFSRGVSRAGLKSEHLKKDGLLEGIPAVPQVPADILAASGGDGAPQKLPRPFSFKEGDSPAASDPVVFLGTAVDGLNISPRSNKREHGKLPQPAVGPPESPLYSIPNTSLQGKFGAPSRPRLVQPHVLHVDNSCTSHEDINGPIPKRDKLSEEPITSPPSLSMNTVPQNVDPESGNLISNLTFLDDDSGIEEHADPPFGFSSAESLCATEETFLPNLASKSTVSGPISPMQLSQPETPIMSEFGDDSTSWTHDSGLMDVDNVQMRPPSRAAPVPPLLSQNLGFSNPFRIHAPLGGFQGYSLPQNEQGSMHTIRKPASPTHFHTDHPLHHQTSSKELFHSWNDASGHRITALEELVDDLGYLGAYIV